MTMPLFACPWCPVLDGPITDEDGVLLLPLAVLPQELCPRCLNFYRQWQAQASAPLRRDQGPEPP